MGRVGGGLGLHWGCSMDGLIVTRSTVYSI